MKRKKINDYLLIIFLLLFAVFLLFFQSELFVSKGSVILITYDSKVIGRYPLIDSLLLPIEEGDSYNLIQLIDGTAVMKEANCKDGLCTKQRAISLKGERIICLPHKIVITVEKGRTSNLDAVTF